MCSNPGERSLTKSTPNCPVKVQAIDMLVALLIEGGTMSVHVSIVKSDVFTDIYNNSI